MFNVKTAYKANKNGTGVIVAKVGGKQRTVKYDHGMSIQANHAAAAGAVLNVVLDDVQQAKVRHPSGAQRVTVATFNDGTGVINVNV